MKRRRRSLHVLQRVEDRRLRLALQLDLLNLEERSKIALVLALNDLEPLLRDREAVGGGKRSDELFRDVHVRPRRRRPVWVPEGLYQID